MNIGIIGCGLIGTKRAQAVSPPHRVSAVCDIRADRAHALAETVNCDFVTDDYKKLIDSGKADLVVVAVLNYQLAPVTLYAVQRGVHVLVEKPAGISSGQLETGMEARKDTDVKVKAGFNHRYHPAMLRAKEIMEREDTGKIMFIRGRYGHGGRCGYDREWRADPKLSGGGETLDQGVHLIDLSRWFMGDFQRADGFAATYFWDMDADDNGFICLRKEDQRAAWLQVSCTEWKNMFSFEIYCERAKLAVEGLGGSYGTERLYYYKMLPEMGPPETVIYEYPRGDQSWKLELEDTLSAIASGTPLRMGSIEDAYEALKIVEKIYGRKQI